MIPKRLLDFLPLAVQSLIQPRVSLRTVLSLRVERPDIIAAGWLVVVISLLLSQLISVLLGAVRTDVSQTQLLFAGALLAAIGIFGGGYLLFRVGVAFKGETNFESCLKTAIWLNFVILLIQLPIPFALRYSPDIFSMLTILVMVLTMIQAVSQVMELHGFTKVLPVLLGVLGAQFLFFLASIVVFQTLGIPLISMETVQ